MSRRTQRVGSLVQRIVAEAIQRRLSDPRIETLTSVTRVEVSPDFSIAKVYVSVMAPEARQKLTLEGLRAAAARIRAWLAPQLVMRKTPQLSFHLDDSIQRSFETIRVLDELRAERGEPLESDFARAHGDDDADDADVREDQAAPPPEDDPPATDSRSTRYNE